MGIAFPSSAGDTSTAAGGLTVSAPANTLNGDLLMFFATNRNGWTSEPSGLTRLIEWSTNGTFAAYVLAVPDITALPPGVGHGDPLAVVGRYWCFE